MFIGSKYHVYRGQNTVVRGSKYDRHMSDIPWVSGQNTMVGGLFTTVRWSKYHG
jgi:hypothetical protein